MVIVHLTASRFLGGPERQMLELAADLPAGTRSAFLSFSEEGLCWAFVHEARRRGYEGIALNHDTPHLWAAWRELTGLLRELECSVLCCHGYKADCVGLLAARRVGIPVIAVSRGWTGESRRVRLYEALDRLVLRWTDRVVCVSEGQAAKVRRAGIPGRKIVVIRNAIRVERFGEPREHYWTRLNGLFAEPPKTIVGAAGRLSPEKGFHVLVDAAASVARANGRVGFVLFGDGPLRNSLAEQIRQAGLNGSFVLARFRTDLDHFLPHLDVVVVPSFTEGLPNVILESFAAGVPVVATAVGGNPEVVQEGENGFLVPPGNSTALAERILTMLRDDARRQEMGLRGRERVRSSFSFTAQAAAYGALFDSLIAPRATPPRKTEPTEVR